LGVVEDDLAALRAHAIPLAGAEPDLPEDDLGPLLERLAGAQLVGLGEATHGDHGSFAFKVRLIQALVRRGRCDVVVFERGVAEMDAFDRYVTGDAEDLPPTGEGLYPWRVEEVRDLFRWLRTWNAAGGDVRVAGMDMQSPAGLPLALRLLDEAGTVAPGTWRRLAAEAAG
jgi:erythromycin esterase